MPMIIFGAFFCAFGIAELLFPHRVIAIWRGPATAWNPLMRTLVEIR